MLRSLRLLSSRVPSLAAWAMLLLCVLVSPMASVLGDLHASTHGQALADAHDLHGHDGTRGDSGEERGLMHALMHGGHCHGHSTAMLPDGMPMPIGQLPCGPQRQAEVLPLRAPLTSLLRPPIYT